MAAKTSRTRTPKTFAEARERLDVLLDELERDTSDIDGLAARIKEASELIRFCRERLASARQEVEQVVADLSAETEQVEDEDDDDEPADEGEASAAPGDLPF